MKKALSIRYYVISRNDGRVLLHLSLYIRVMTSVYMCKTFPNMLLAISTLCIHAIILGWLFLTFFETFCTKNVFSVLHFYIR